MLPSRVTLMAARQAVAKAAREGSAKHAGKVKETAATATASRLDDAAPAVAKTQRKKKADAEQPAAAAPAAAASSELPSEEFTGKTVTTLSLTWPPPAEALGHHPELAVSPRFADPSLALPQEAWAESTGKG